MNTQLKKRISSFLWRGGAIAVVAFLSFVVKNIGEFNLPEYIVVIVGLIIGEITKYLNTGRKA